MGGRFLEICRYHGKEICSYDLKNENGIYRQENVIELKRAAARKELICVDCGKRVYLAAGLIREPYFAHYEAEQCAYGRLGESEESRLAKRLIYQMLKRSFSKETVYARHRLEDGTYTTFYITNDSGEDLGIDYRLTQLPIKLLDKRVDYLKQHQIRPIFFLSDQSSKDRNQLSWYQEYMQDLIGYCIFFHRSKEEFVFKRSFHYQYETYRVDRVFERHLSIQNASLNKDGTFVCDFGEKCMQREQEIIDQIHQEAELERKEKIRQLQYKRQQMLKEATQEKQSLMTRLTKIMDRIDFNEMDLPSNLRRDILNECLRMIPEGDVELISEKYRNYLLSFEYYA